MRLRHIRDVGSGGHHRVYQPCLGVDPNVRFHAEVPLVALLRLVHLRVALTAGVLGRAGSSNERGIHDGAALEHEATLGQDAIDRLEDTLAQAVLLQQVAKAQDGALIRHDIHPQVQTNKARQQRRVVQGFLHRRVRQTKPLLQKMNPQQLLYRKGWPPTLGTRLRRIRLDECDQLCPRHHTVHLLQKRTLAGALGAQLKARIHRRLQTHLLHVAIVPSRQSGRKVLQTFPRSRLPTLQALQKLPNPRRRPVSRGKGRPRHRTSAARRAHPQYYG
ncbi:hypothetical protein LMG8323_03672 [Ralstonia mannitolilytica]|nr:hypothetical protein LMG8323_03672 [Ralstonia mannitolilytica]